MKRTTLVLAVIALWALPAAGAQAKDVAVEHVKQDKRDVEAYWTTERMQNARAVKTEQGGGPTTTAKPTGTTSWSGYEVIAPYTTLPISTHGKVFFSDGTFNYVCSGTALSSDNESVVWTAGHCVNEGPGGYYSNWMFVPAYRDGAEPLGRWTATTLLTTSAWRNSGDFAYDLGAAIVHPNGGATLTDTAGGRQINTSLNPSATGLRFVAYGYPAEGKFKGNRLRACDSPLLGRDGNFTPNTLMIGCDMNGGSSGGGWIVGGAVVSVNSYGYGGLRNRMFGPQQETVAESLYTTASATANP